MIQRLRWGHAAGHRPPIAGTVAFSTGQYLQFSECVIVRLVVVGLPRAGAAKKALSADAMNGQIGIQTLFESAITSKKEFATTAKVTYPTGNQPDDGAG